MSKPEEVEILTDIELLTEEQIRNAITAAEAEATWIKDHGDKTVKNVRRVRELIEYRNALTAALNEMTAPLPETDDVVEHTDVAPAAADETLTEEEVDAAKAPDAVPADIEEMKQAIMAELTEQLAANSSGPTTENSGIDDAGQTTETPEAQHALYASLDNTPINEDVSRLNGAAKTTLDKAVSRLQQAKSTISGWSDSTTFHVFGVDKFAAIRAELNGGTLGADKELNSNLIAASSVNPFAEPIRAALCGTMKEINIGPDCYMDAQSPFYDSIGETMAADGCGVKWRKHLKPEDFKNGTFIWDACKQAGIDPADKTTWKPVATLPQECDDAYCSAEPFYIGAGLKVSVDDMFCRKDVIEEANSIIKAFRAKRLDQAALFIADKASTHRSVALTPGLGLRSALEIAIVQLIVRRNIGDIRCLGDLVAYVPRYLATMLALDMSLAGERGSSAESLIADMFRTYGISRVVFIDTWGCEGNLIEPYVDAQPEVCATSCADGSFEVTCDDLVFQTGDDLEALPTEAVIRLLDPSDFVKGETGVEDYMLRKDNDDRLQNCGLYFGESRHLLFPKRDRRRFRLDISGICVNGNRIDRTATLDCSTSVAPPGGYEIVPPADDAPVTDEPVVDAPVEPASGLVTA